MTDIINHWIMNTLLPLLNLPAPSIEDRQPAPAQPTLKLDRRTYDRALSCNNCGLCLPACPTYLQTGHEAEGPRGRIQLMRGLSDGKIDPTRKVRQHLDSCLNCRGCESACPTGVVYHELIEETRDRIAKHDRENPPAFESYRGVLRWFVHNVVTHPNRLKVSVAPIRLLKRAGVYRVLERFRVMELLPPALRKMEQMLPESGPIWPRPLPRFTGAKGMDAVLVALQNSAILGQNGVERRRTVRNEKHTRKIVGFFAGCVGSIFYDRVNRMAIELLAASGVDVYTPFQQGCCGAIHKQTGELERARQLARKNIDLFIPRDATAVDFIVTNIGGCGSTLMEYDVLLRDDPEYASLAREFRRRYRDISQMLAELTLPKMIHPVNLTATYHDACHLSHAQRLRQLPRELLARIPGLKLVPLAEADLCCGAAGAYNLEQPQMAAGLADRKLDNVAAAKADVLISGNAGCASHLAAQAKSRGQSIKIVHPVELIHQAVFGPMHV
jgi:glycolate oxidase iron-sulfur subunit